MSNLEEKLAELIQTPIEFDYPMCNVTQLGEENACQLLDDTQGLDLQNAYFQMGMPGTQSTMFARAGVVKRLHNVARQLQGVAVLSVFDAYRSIQTQAYLYDGFCSDMRQRHPDWTAEQAEQEALKFVSHPYDTSRFAAPLHNTGGAVDVQILELNKKKSWDFGTKIDTTEELSFTDYFEQAYFEESGIDEARWYRIRANRRILFHLMRKQDFVNFSNEWWHYDLGDGNWAAAHKTDPVFASMEADVV